MADRDRMLARLAGQVRGLEAVVQAMVALIPMVGAQDAIEINKRSRSLARMRRSLLEQARRMDQGAPDPQTGEVVQQAMLRTIDRAFSSALKNMEKMAAMAEGEGKSRQ